MSFEKLNLSNALLNAIADMGFQQPTPIQEKVYATIMSGRDVVGVAQTGTGKTLAYLLPTLRQWRYSGTGNPQIVILVPTRELVIQVVNQIKSLTTYMNVVVAGVYGGVNINTQIETVYKGLDILVATPGRMYDLALKGVLRLKSVKKIIIDEIDEMLNLGFRPQINNIIELLPKKRQNLMFSATLTGDIEKLIKDYFLDPIKIFTVPIGTPLEKISQKYFIVPNFYTKINLLEHLLLHDESISKVLIFVSTKKNADKLMLKIQANFEDQIGIIHSNKAQNKRFNTINKFDQGVFKILIATDILARGLDITDISHVINFDMPEIAIDYIHRIGRTGRAEKSGDAISFVLENEILLKNEIETLMELKMVKEEIPNHVQISEVLLEHEKPNFNIKKSHNRNEKILLSGPAFHEKKAKNQKIQKRISHKAKMHAKYGKPKTRGQKK